MMLNSKQCQTCKGFHAPVNASDLPPPIEESSTVKRGDSRFFECPDCFRLFAVKAIKNSEPPQYRIVSSASVNTRFEWIIDAEDGSRQKAKSKMTEEDALEKHPNAVKVPPRTADENR